MITVGGSSTKFYNAMRKEFGYIGSNSGLNDFLNENNNKLTEREVDSAVEQLKAVE